MAGQLGRSIWQSVAAWSELALVALREAPGAVAALARLLWRRHIEAPVRRHVAMRCVRLALRLHRRASVEALEASIDAEFAAIEAVIRRGPPVDVTTTLPRASSLPLSPTATPAFPAPHRLPSLDTSDLPAWLAPVTPQPPTPAQPWTLASSPSGDAQQARQSPRQERLVGPSLPEIADAYNRPLHPPVDALNMRQIMREVGRIAILAETRPRHYAEQIADCVGRLTLLIGALRVQDALGDGLRVSGQVIYPTAPGDIVTHLTPDVQPDVQPHSMGQERHDTQDTQDAQDIQDSGPDTDGGLTALGAS